MSAPGQDAGEVSRRWIRLRGTVEAIRAVQLADGMIPWFAGGHADPWNHVEAAMALAVGGAIVEAERAYGWLEATQRPDGAWHTYYLPGGEIEEPRLDTNVSSYVATGVWHHFLLTGDRGFLEQLWPVVDRAIEFAISWQRSGGELVWSVEPDGTPGRFGLVTGSSSAYFSLRCALGCAEALGLERPGWQLAAGELRHALRSGSAGFVDKDEFAMDWYYPVLVGALEESTARERIELRWDEFVIEGQGVRCVSHKSWVTAAETAECAIALSVIDRPELALRMLEWTDHHRSPDGSYTTGLVHPDQASYPPGERSSYTAAAVVLATDAVFAMTPAALLFTDAQLPRGLELEPGSVTRLSTRRLPQPEEVSSTNSPPLRARR